MNTDMKKFLWLKFTARVRMSSGMTLIETLIYCILLSFLLSGFIRYAYGVHFSDFEVIDDINTQ